jgi:hypothetical protein
MSRPRRWFQLALAFQLDLPFADPSSPAADPSPAPHAERSEHSDQRERSPSRCEQDQPSTAQDATLAPEPGQAGVEVGGIAPRLPAPPSKACVPRRPMPPGVVRRGVTRC